jgi:hypothetical protein
MKLQNNFVLGLLALTAAAGMVSCSSDEPAGSVNNDSTEAISMEAYVARSVNGSRASIENLTSLQGSNNGFKVYGYYLGTTAVASYSFGQANLINGSNVTYDSDNNAWTYSPKKYWTKNTGENYRFAAVAPLSASVTETSAPVVNYDATSNNIDLMTSVKDVVSASTNNKVAFEFAHRTSRVAVNAYTTADYSAGAKVEITSLKISGIRQKGTFDVLAGTWSSQSTADLTLITSATEISASKATASTTIDATDANVMGKSSYLFAVPNSTATDLVMTVSYKVTQDNVVYEYTNKSLKYNVALVQGNSYNLNLKIGLDAIEFDVTSVAGWTTGSDVENSL